MHTVWTHWVNWIIRWQICWSEILVALKHWCSIFCCDNINIIWMWDSCVALNIFFRLIKWLIKQIYQNTTDHYLPLMFWSLSEVLIRRSLFSSFSGIVMAESWNGKKSVACVAEYVAALVAIYRLLARTRIRIESTSFDEGLWLRSKR